MVCRGLVKLARSPQLRSKIQVLWLVSREIALRLAVGVLKASRCIRTKKFRALEL